MKEKTRKAMSRHTDGWLVTNPDRVSNLTPILSFFTTSTFQLPSCVRIDRLEWPTGGEMVASLV